MNDWQILSPSSPDRGGPSFSELISSNPAAEDCKERMGWTSENVASDFNIIREEQDAFAAASFIKAEAAQKNGLFSKEIVPFTVLRKDGSSNQRVPVIITEDDGIRYGTTQEKLSKIKPAFPQWGNSTTTGGNASQITDGAAAVLLMSRREAEKRGLRVLAKHVTTAVAGNDIPSNLKIAYVFFRCTTTYHGRWPSIFHSHGIKERRFAVGRCGSLRSKYLSSVAYA